MSNNDKGNSKKIRILFNDLILYNLIDQNKSAGQNESNNYHVNCLGMHRLECWTNNSH